MGFSKKTKKQNVFLTIWKDFYARHNLILKYSIYVV